MIQTCPRCQKVHVSQGSLCLACRQKEDDQFALVAEYVQNNPHVQAKEVAEETGVDVSSVMKWIKEGRLIAHFRYTCERCGKTISSGRYCPECVVELQHDLNRLKDSLTKREGYYAKPDIKR